MESRKETISGERIGGTPHMLWEGAQASYHLGRAGSMTIDSVGREQTSYLRAFARAIAGG